MEKEWLSRPSGLTSPQVGDDFAAVSVATAHRITGPVSNTALDLVGIGPGTRILDIAAGAGALSGPAAERGASVLATDLAPGMVRRLTERLRPFRRCKAQGMNGEALTVADESFDAAFSIFGLMLFSDWRRGLREQVRVFRPGGKACVATWAEPPGGGPFVAMGAPLRSVFPHLKPPPPPSGMLALFDAGRLSGEMSAAGLGSIEVLQFEGIWRGALETPISTIPRLCMVTCNPTRLSIKWIASGSERRSGHSLQSGVLKRRSSFVPWCFSQLATASDIGWTTITAIRAKNG
jgi:SAM-dependent methyltransferase